MGYSRAIVDADRRIVDGELSVPHLNMSKLLANDYDSLDTGSDDFFASSVGSSQCEVEFDNLRSGFLN